MMQEKHKMKVNHTKVKDQKEVLEVMKSDNLPDGILYFEYEDGGFMITNKDALKDMNGVYKVVSKEINDIMEYGKIQN